MKLIMENWKRFLNEEVNSSIQKQIEKLINYNPERFIKISGNSNSKIFQYVSQKLDADDAEYLVSSDEKDFDLEITPAVGYLSISKILEQGAPCLGAWKITWVQASDNMGPLLFEVALEWASQNNGGLTTDKGKDANTTSAVRNVFNKYLGRRPKDLKWFEPGAKSGLSMKQLDLTAGDAKKHGLEQHTPDFKADDCRIHIPSDKEKWKEDSLNKVYYKPDSEVMTSLLKAGKLIGWEPASKT